MTPLTFLTPSRRCPLRHHNGEEIRFIGMTLERRLVRRIGHRVPAYLVHFQNGEYGIALPDELFIEPTR